MNTSRRQFLEQTAASATAVLTASRVFAQAKGEEAVNQTDVPIIDCHQHLWDLGKFKLPWIKVGGLLARSFVMTDYLAAIEGTGIEHSVYMEVDVEPSQQQAEAEHLIEICKSGKAPTIAAVISGRPAAYSFGQYIKPLGAIPYIKGIRQVLHGSSTPEG